MNIIDSIENVLSGSMVYYGGIACLSISIIAIVICAVVFPKRRKRMLDRLGDE